MRKLSALVSTILIISFLQPSSANAESCFDSWPPENISLALTPTITEVNAARSQNWKVDLQIPASITTRISSYGANIAVSKFYEVSSSKDFSILKHPLNSGMKNFSYVQSDEFYARHFGIGNNDFIRYVMQIDIKGCQVAFLRSNIVQYANMITSPIGIDTFFSQIQLGTCCGTQANFKQIEMAKMNVQEVSTKLKSISAPGTTISVTRTIDGDFSPNFQMTSMDADSCVTMNPDDYSVKSVTIKSLPCNVGIFYWSPITSGRYSFALVDVVKIAKPAVTNTVPSVKKTSSVICQNLKTKKKVQQKAPCPKGFTQLKG